jgi:hypothetical protein
VKLRAITPFVLVIFALGFLSLGLGLYGIERSLWLDEAWVANSVLAPTLSGMFYYPDWLQTTPPLFLLLTRAVVPVFDTSNAAFRVAPLGLALAGVAFMVAVARRLVSLPLAALTAGLLTCHPVTIEYSRTCKQYSGEMAASAAILLFTALYLQQPDLRRFYGLTAAFVITLPLAWSVAFLLPGVAIAVWARRPEGLLHENGGMRRAATLVSIAGVVLAILYFAFIRPNLAPRLREFWIANAQPLSPGLAAAIVFCVAAGVWSARHRNWMLFVTMLPCVLLVAANAMRLYPATPRTRLFALPCFLLGSALVVHHVVRWRHMGTVAWIVLIAAGSQAAWKQVSEHRNQTEEDYAGAVQYLRKHVAPADLLLVHASLIEGFKLYWPNSRAIFGDTGRPCCHRGPFTRLSRKQAVIDDLDRKIPKEFSGRLWLVYSTRDTHWNYIGLDEGKLWRNHVWDKGCPPGPYLAFPNLAISPMNCVQAR